MLDFSFVGFPDAFCDSGSDSAMRRVLCYVLADNVVTDW
jgi:hypothetical protein